MAPFVIPAVIELAKAIPKLGSLFADSEQAKKNVAAAEVVVNAVVEATGAANAQEAVEKVQNDPTAAAAADKAVESVWYQITDAGGGGIDGARKADEKARAAGDFLKSPSFWVAIILTPLVYMVVGSVVGLYGRQWSDDAATGLANGVVGMVLGGLVGYYFGQVTSRNRN